jgi:hypothetical protein
MKSMGRLEKRLSLAVLVAALSMFAIGWSLVRTSAEEPQVRLDTKEPGVATEDESLLLALPLANIGDDTATDVRVDGITLGEQELLKPAELPLVLGEIVAGKDTVLQLAFRKEGLVGDTQYVLKIHGTFLANRTVERFEAESSIALPEPGEGKRRASTTNVKAQRVEGGNFPSNHAAVHPPKVNEFEGPPLPEGKLIGAIAPNNPSAEIVQLTGGTSKESAQPANEHERILQAANDPVTFRRVRTSVIGSFPVLDPSGASVDVPRPIGSPLRFVFLTGNLYLLISADGGATFTKVDPTTIFPSIPLDGLPEDAGFCCDQNAIYIPSINRIVWTVLTGGSQADVERDKYGVPILDENGKEKPINGFNRIRVASASPQQLISSVGTSWRWWDMTTATFGFDRLAFLDYPDISFTDNFLHISANRVGPGQGGLFVARIPLSDVVSGPTIHIGFTNPDVSKKAEGGRLTHDAPDAAYWFGHDTTSTLQIFEWLDGLNVYSWHSIPNDSWTQIFDPNGPEGESITPSGVNWLGANIPAVRGATFQSTFRRSVGGQFVDGRRITIAWNAGRGGEFPQPYVRLLPVIKLGDTWSHEPSFQIWHPNFASQSACLATNANGEVGVAFAAGGGPYEATPVTGFAGETPYYMNNVSTRSCECGRFGDYFTIRPHWRNNKLFSVSDYFLFYEDTVLGPVAKVAHQYRLFGRDADIGNTF